MTHMPIIIDYRWSGDHGIGRFAREVAARLPDTVRFQGGIRPSNPLDILYLSGAVLRTSPQYWFSPGYNVPIFGCQRYVFTIHDLNHVDVPDNSGSMKRLYYNLFMKRACRRAARVLTVSDFSRNRIIEWSRVEASKVVNVGNGVSDVFHPAAERPEIRYSYILSVSNRKAHKNERRLVRAFRLAEFGPHVRLVFTGNASEELMGELRSAGLHEQVLFLGKISDRELARWYRGALALAFPSLYEGFGLPVVEAMACGTPVITSTTTSLPEIAGEAALLVDPLSEREIGAALRRVVVDAGLRERLSRAGIKRAQMFSWEAVAAKVHAAIVESYAKGRKVQ